MKEVKELLALFFVALFCSGLGSILGCTLIGLSVEPPKPSEKMEIFVTNSTDLPVTAQVQAGLLSRNIDLDPGQTRNFWAPKGLLPDTVSVKLTARQGRSR